MWLKTIDFHPWTSWFLCAFFYHSNKIQVIIVSTHGILVKTKLTHVIFNSRG